jgi:hypothetical protein
MGEDGRRRVEKKFSRSIMIGQIARVYGSLGLKPCCFHAICHILFSE